jgi:hypothetical protein
MTYSEALTEITMLCEATEDPTLSAEQLAYLAGKAKKLTSEGVSPEPGSELYADSATVTRAIALGWQLKKGRAVKYFNAASDRQKFELDQIFQHCKQMALDWASQAAALATPSGAPRVGQLTKPDTSKLSL